MSVSNRKTLCIELTDKHNTWTKNMKGNEILLLKFNRYIKLMLTIEIIPFQLM